MASAVRKMLFTRVITGLTVKLYVELSPLTYGIYIALKRTCVTILKCIGYNYNTGRRRVGHHKPRWVLYICRASGHLSLPTT